MIPQFNFQIIFPVVLLIFGFCIGSFLNVVSDRIVKKEGFLSNRSYCPHCKHTLSALDLIPIFSFVLLKGRCRYCHTKLSLWYPLSEILTGIVFLFCFYTLNLNQELTIINLSYFLSISSIFIIIFLTDAKYGIIPDKIVLSGIIFASVYLVGTRSDMILNHILSAFSAFAFFLLLVLLTKGKGMGMGDVKFSFLIGLILGFPVVLSALYIAFLTGAAIGIILILWKKKKIKESISFGPFLALGTLITLFWGNLITNYTLRIFGF